ncbi:MAG TPA: enolase C-terminal domain-like protein [Candidatus Binatia bacterium]|nr:enolase C-terminal domain-like protein [Candidatus Binatia bacterium]
MFTIKSVQTWRAVLRRETAWKTARYTKGDIEAMVVGLTDADGTTGYGYMPSMSIVGESPLSSESLIQGLLLPVIEGQSFIGIQPVLREIEQVLGANFQTKFAIEEALCDLLAKKLQTPVVNLIGGACRSEVPVMRMLGLKPPQETAAEAKALVDRGYRHVKVKIGLDEKRDAETVLRVREAIGDEVFLSADANQAYAPMQAVRVLGQLESVRLGLVEQPVRRDDIRGMAFVRQNVSVPIMADEGIETAPDALRHIEAGAMDAVSIKLWKMGGLYRGREIASVCSAANVRIHVGSTAGSQLLEAIQLHFCASLTDLFGGAEISEFESLTNDPASGLLVENGALRVPNVPGLGIVIDHDKLRETTGLWGGK